MIRIFIGNVGSGKTATFVRELILNPTNRNTYSNIKTKKVKNNVLFTSDMLVKKEIVEYKKKRDGTETPVEKLSFNQEFWQETVKREGCINICVDEAHTVYDARRSMSTRNKIMGDFMALMRRVLGNSPSGYGNCTFITQLPNRIDKIARDMCTHVRYHRCHYMKSCNKCGCSWQEHSDNPEPRHSCPNCFSFDIYIHDNRIEIWHFDSIKSYEAWTDFGINTFHLHYFVNDIEKYFPHYDTLQWDNLLSEY